MKIDYEWPSLMILSVSRSETQTSIYENSMSDGNVHSYV